MASFGKIRAHTSFVFFGFPFISFDEFRPWCFFHRRTIAESTLFRRLFDDNQISSPIKRRNHVLSVLFFPPQVSPILTFGRNCSPSCLLIVVLTFFFFHCQCTATATLPIDLTPDAEMGWPPLGLPCRTGVTMGLPMEVAPFLGVPFEVMALWLMDEPGCSPMIVHSPPDTEMD
jgi:hypothetical protein